MNNRWLPRTIMVLAALLALASLTGCEKNRPAPTPLPTSGVVPGTTLPTQQPPAGLNQPIPQAQRTQAGGAQVAAPTPVPLVKSSPTPAPPGSAESAPAPRQNVTTSSSSGTFIYEVEVGDTLGEIAQRYGVTTQEIIVLNPLANPDVLMVGQELVIPGESTGAAGGSSGGSSGAYVVNPGDTLSSIAVRFGVTLAELMELNNISNPDQISVGTSLRIPATGSAPEAEESSQPTSYVVQAGDTLFSIATRHGVTLAALQAANGIVNENQIYVGQVLTIP